VDSEEVGANQRAREKRNRRKLKQYNNPSRFARSRNSIQDSPKAPLVHCLNFFLSFDSGLDLTVEVPVKAERVLVYCV
jgi:hypothetical protein